MSLPVMFRKLKSGAVIGILPTLPAGQGAIETSCRAFTKEGEVTVDTSITHVTTEAQPFEYVQLLIDMANAGYKDIRVTKRITQQLHDQRANNSLMIKRAA